MLEVHRITGAEPEQEHQNVGSGKWEQGQVKLELAAHFFAFQPHESRPLTPFNRDFPYQHLNKAVPSSPCRL